MRSVLAMGALVLLVVVQNPQNGWAQPVAAANPSRPVPVIFDTDIGNDCDDVLALAMLHTLANRGEVDLLAVTITKDNPLAARFVSTLNSYYGRPDIPIGVVRGGKTPEAGKFLPLADKRENGQLVYPRSLDDKKEVPEAVAVLRQTLAKAKDQTVSIVQVGWNWCEKKCVNYRSWPAPSRCSMARSTASTTSWRISPPRKNWLQPGPPPSSGAALR